MLVLRPNAANPTLNYTIKMIFWLNVAAILIVNCLITSKYIYMYKNNKIITITIITITNIFNQFSIFKSPSGHSLPVCSSNIYLGV